MAVTEERLREIIREELAAFAQRVADEATGDYIHYDENVNNHGEGQDAVNSVFAAVAAELREERGG